MTSIIKAVFEATIGLLVSKGRDAAAETLKEGDVTDQKLRGLIVREIQEIKSKLDGLSRKDLLAAVDYFEAGLGYLYTAIDAKRSDEVTAATAETNEKIKEENVDEFSSHLPTNAGIRDALAAGLRNLELTELDKRTRSALFQAKERFKVTRERTTDASNNEALVMLDRITAIRYRVMATVLESAVETMATLTTRDLSSFSVKDALENALPECEQCLQKLHSLPAVQNSFKVEFQKGLNLRGQFAKDERMKIISTVCQVNRAIYNVTQTVGKAVYVWAWPFVDTGKDKVDPLRDGRVNNALRSVGMEHYCVPWSFGQQGKKEHKLKCPAWGISTNIRGQFIVADGDKAVKVYGSNGNFLLSFNIQTDDVDAMIDVFDVSSDMLNNVYVLVGEGRQWEVRVYNDRTALQLKFPVRKGDWGWIKLTVSKLVVLRKSEGEKDVVDVYKHDGRFVCTFGEGMFAYATDITAAKDDCVMIIDRNDSCVQSFTVEGKQLSKFKINKKDYFYSISCHQAGEHVVLGGQELVTRRLIVAIFTKDGEFVRRILLPVVGLFGLGKITVTMNGHIAVCLKEEHGNTKVLVL